MKRRVFLSTLLVYWAVRAAPTPHNEHIRLAYSILHGHLNVNQYPVWENVVVQGYMYTLHPPLAALASLPFVAVGIYDQTFISLIYGALAVMLAFTLTESLWLTIFFALGTVFTYEATLGASWGLCLTLSCIPTFLVLIELAGKARSWLVGLLAVVACFARYDLVMVLPIYAILLAYKHKLSLSFFTPILIGLGAYCTYNLARFGTFTDVSLWLWYQKESAGLALHPGLGPFSLHYLPLGIYTALFLGPGFSNVWPYIHPSVFGLSLFCTSPGFILALRPSLLKVENLLLWLAVILSMGGALCVYSNGVEQLGARYWIMAFPFLLALMAKSPNDQLAKILIVSSVAFTSFFFWHARYLGLAT